MNSQKQKCNFCKKDSENLYEYYPHKSGGYCIFLPRNETYYAYDECNLRTCEVCGLKQVRTACIACQNCKKVHCFNNTDMIYENNRFLKNIRLCSSRHCGNKEKNY